MSENFDCELVKGENYGACCWDFYARTCSWAEVVPYGIPPPCMAEFQKEQYKALVAQIPKSIENQLMFHSQLQD
jgi:hypothetical protein